MAYREIEYLSRHATHSLLPEAKLHIKIKTGVLRDRKNWILKNKNMQVLDKYNKVTSKVKLLFRFPITSSAKNTGSRYDGYLISDVGKEPGVVIAYSTELYKIQVLY